MVNVSLCFNSISLLHRLQTAVILRTGLGGSCFQHGEGSHITLDNNDLDKEIKISLKSPIIGHKPVQIKTSSKINSS